MDVSENGNHAQPPPRLRRARDDFFMLIGFSQMTDKLVFAGVHPRLAVIANQCAHWCGNPPDRGEMYRQLPYRAGKRCGFWW